MTDLYRVSNEEILCVDKFIGDESCAELCSRLSQKESTSLNDNSTVKRLVLRGNCLSTRSAQSLGNMLRGNHTLEMLSLEWNQLGSSGASFIAHGKKHMYACSYTADTPCFEHILTLILTPCYAKA